MRLRGSAFISIAIAAAALSACAGGEKSREAEENRRLFGVLDGDETSAPPEIGVNSFLWRASLDTISFMPLASADPFGGVITTDWYADPAQPTERFKATVYILDSRLRADGVKVALSKERLTANGWITAEVDPDAALQIENAILTRARQLKLSTVGG